ncbi:MAG TPA: hypothetical protein VFM12_06360 [Gemmatimonadales bacterium]|nr:hypothetical protein [Gemmatimonadales bacterium]
MSFLNPNLRYCPICGSVGVTDEASGMQICTGNGLHRFWAATRRCGCGFIPVIPAEGDVWVCVNCDAWELVR